jgi:hypothetical protein
MKLYGVEGIVLNSVQDEFFYWITLYYGVMANLFGEDKDDAVEAMDNDSEFDKWLESYQKKQQRQLRGSNTPSSGKTISKEAVLARMRGKAADDDL